jgi:hypothetical protein
MDVSALILFSFLLAVFFGGLGWTKLMLWEWQADREQG